MNAITAKPIDTKIKNESTTKFLGPDWVETEMDFKSHVERPRSLLSVLNSICEDSNKHPMQYVLRCDTGHDGE